MYETAARSSSLLISKNRNLQAMHAPIVNRLALAPTIQHHLSIPQPQDLDPQGSTSLQHSGRTLLTPTVNTQITTWTRRHCHEQIRLGEERQVRVLRCRRGLHEVLAVLVEAGDLEDVQDVMDIRFGEVVGKDGAGEVGVALVVEIVAAEELVDCRSV